MQSQKDTMNWLVIDSVKGSEIEEDKRNLLQPFHVSSPVEISEKDTLAYFNRISAYIRQHPASKLGAYLISESLPLSYPSLYSLFTQLDTSLNNSFEMSQIHAQLRSKQKRLLGMYNVGMPFHNVTLPDIDDKLVNTADLKGTYFLLICWASWCTPCRNEVPDLKKVFNRYKDRGLTPVGISLDNRKAKWLNAIREDGVLWMQLIDTKAFGGDLANYYDILAIPKLFLLDKDKKIIMAEVSLEKIADKLEELIK